MENKKTSKKMRLKLWLAVAIGGGTLFWGLSLFAGPLSVPHQINFQSVVTDAGGVPLVDGLHNINFRLADAGGINVYEEKQSLESVGGVVSAMVGSQGDISAAFSISGKPLFLGVQVEGGGPETLMEIVSVPYAVVAEQALRVVPKSIGTEAIVPKSITKDLLADDVLSGIAPIYQNESGASKVGVETNFIYSRGPTVQVVLKDMDTAIHQREVNLEKQKTDLQNQINTKASTDYVNQKVEGKPSVDEVGRMISSASQSLSVSMDQGQAGLQEQITDIDTSLNALPKIVAYGVINSGVDTSTGACYPPYPSNVYNVDDVTRGDDHVYQIIFKTRIEPPYIVTGNVIYRSIRDVINLDNKHFAVKGGSMTSVGFQASIHNECQQSFNFMVVK